MNIHFSSQRLDWKTPKAVYQILDAEFNFDHDPCPPNYKVDGLLSDWGGRNFVNPPYGRELPKWVQKSYEEWLKGKTVVMLIPSRTDTRWWHDYCMKATEIRFIKGRLKFDEAIEHLARLEKHDHWYAQQKCLIKWWHRRHCVAEHKS